MQVISCSKCGITFGITLGLDFELKKNGKTFYCPMGHAMFYGDSITEQLKRTKELCVISEKRYRDELARRQRVQRSNAAFRAVITRMKNKAAKQV